MISDMMNKFLFFAIDLVSLGLPVSLMTHFSSPGDYFSLYNSENTLNSHLFSPKSPYSIITNRDPKIAYFNSKGSSVTGNRDLENPIEKSKNDGRSLMGAHSSFHLLGKRLFDVLSSLIAIILLSPFILIIAIAIKTDSPGPVFYRGRRMGKNGKPFTMLKFRSMYETPASYAGPSITGNGDERITPLGQWLRKTKVNELPQLWNVLKGDMSIVGPRPEDVEIAMAWPDEVRQKVLSARPGITSPASIVYRDEERLLERATLLDDYLKKILPNKLRLDQLYVDSLSFWTDLDVIFTTLVVFLPLLRNVRVNEKTMFSGPFFSFFSRVFRWFLVDILVTMFCVGLAGVVWRISTVINLGVLTFIVVALVIAVLLSIINTLLGLHRVTWRNASPTYVLDIGLSVTVTCLIVWLANRLWLTTPWIPFSMIWLMGIMIYIGLVAARFRERILTGLANRWLIFRGGEVTFGERILVVGAGELGELAVWLLQRSAFMSFFSVVGVVDDNARKQGLRITGYKVLGTTEEIPDLVSKYDIGVIIFAIANCQPKEKDRILTLSQATGARVVEIPDLVKVLERSIQKMEADDRE